jgi:DNA-binding CsgD family transcriptional regulator
MAGRSADDEIAAGDAALAAGRWEEARAAFEAARAGGERAEACFGLAAALWWQGENQTSVAHCTRAYSMFRQSGDVVGAVRCAVWLGITYKANYANFAVASGWIGRADRLLEKVERGPLHGWAWLARAYRSSDLTAAEELTVQALDVARAAGDVDLELVALSQIGLIRVGKGETAAGFALIDEAMAAALAGERSQLETVAYACCDMLNACELANDLERAAQWCQVADEFVEKYGCPFLYAECRIFYGSVLTAKGRWDEADRELAAGLRITEGSCPALHATALMRLVRLRVRQGRLEEAAGLLARLGAGVEAQQEVALSVAALLLARGDALAASRNLEQRLHHLAEHRVHLVAGLELLVDAYLAAGDLTAAGAAADRLAGAVASTDDDGLRASVLAAEGRVALERGDFGAAALALERALAVWSRLKLPFEVARTRHELGRALAGSSPEVAIEHARHALASLEGLGAALDADRAAAFLRSMGVSARTGAKGVGLLTAREQEVLSLLGAGLSNPEIAQRLHVSRKTASHHVSNILGKLDLRNRMEAAAYAVKALGAPGPLPSGKR